MPTVKKNTQKIDNQKYAYNFFIAKGYEPHQAAGIVGNLMAESGLNPTVKPGDNGTAFGIAQWRGDDRFGKLKSMYGEDWTKLDNQLAFVDWELNNTYKKVGDKLRKTSNVTEAGKIFTNEYERPQKKWFEDDRRQGFVYETFMRFKGHELSAEEKQLYSNLGKNIQKPVMNLDIPKYMGNFASVPETEKTPAKEDEDLKALEQKNQEDSFLQEYAQLKIQQPVQQQTQQQPVIEQGYTPANLIETFNAVSQFIDTPIAQQGGKVDMYGNPLTDRIIQTDNPRTFYDDRTSTIVLGQDYLNADDKTKEKILAHENRHDWQYKNDRSNFNITHNPEYAFNERLQKKPIMVNSDEVYNNYHNRQQVETLMELEKVKKDYPELFSFISNQILYDKGIANSLYDNPFSLEGEAEYYQNTGKQSFQQGGKVKKPIYVDSAKDPRYRAYQDSLNLYNATKNDISRLKKAKSPEEWYEYTKNWEKNNPKAIPSALALRKLNKKAPKPVQQLDRFNDMAHAEVYKKPQQPVAVSKNINNVVENTSQQPVIVERPTYEPIQITPEGYAATETELKANLNITPQARIPEYFNVTDKVNQNFGGTETNYRWYPDQPLPPSISEQTYEDGTPMNTRTMTPVYQQGGGVKTTPLGQYQYPGEITNIPSNNITMQGVPYNLLAIADTGETRILEPNKEYSFKGANSVTEIPLLTEQEKAFLKELYGQK